MRSARKAIELAPTSTVGYVTAGNVELGIGRIGRAKKHYQRALELDPTDRIAQANLAIISRARGETDAALTSLQVLLNVDPRDATARRLLDDTIHAAIVDLQWVVLGIGVILAAVRGV